MFLVEYSNYTSENIISRSPISTKKHHQTNKIQKTQNENQQIKLKIENHYTKNKK